MSTTKKVFDKLYTENKTMKKNKRLQERRLRIKIREIIERENLKEENISTIELARAYHVNLDQKDFDELGKTISRDKFKKYFNIPKDADEDPGYKRDRKFDLKKLSKIKGSK